MYKIDDEFRPGGRVFVKATHENQVPVPERKSSLKKFPATVAKGPAITTNLDDRNIRFQHEVKHERTVEALITDYPPNYVPPAAGVGTSQKSITHTIPRSGTSSNSKEVVIQRRHNGSYPGSGIPEIPDHINSLQAVTRNKRVSTEVLGSSLETTKTSQRAPDGHRRITTHIVRKVTTLSRAEEHANAQDMLNKAKDVRTTSIGYEETRAIEPKRPKVT